MPFSVVARCGPGHPLVIRNHPLDPQGHPFPTLYWLTCPDAVRAVSRLESEGWIGRLDRQAEVDPELRTRLRRAHEEYARERGRAVAGAEGWGGVGGTRRGIKCLHAHYAYALSGGADPVGGWVARRVAADSLHHARPARRVGAVDLGTNSIRLLVARIDDEGALRELSRAMVITRLGEGVDRTGELSPAALRRTVGALARYCRRARAMGAERVHLAATSAVRDAANRRELEEAVTRLTGEPMEVLSGEDEGRLTFLGATRDLDAPRPHLVLDIGGGSTEFVLGDGTGRPGTVVSTQMGSVRLTERFVRQDPPAAHELAAMEEAIASNLEAVENGMPVRQARTLVAVGGTATTVQAISMSLPEYDPVALHRSVLSRGAAEHVFRLLADLTTAERRTMPVMAPGREDVIPAGAAILAGALRRWAFDDAIVSETDILDGIAYRMVEVPPGR